MNRLMWSLSGWLNDNVLDHFGLVLGKKGSVDMQGGKWRMWRW